MKTRIQRKQSRRVRHVGTTVVAGLLAGCAVGPDYVKPEMGVIVPPVWSAVLADVDFRSDGHADAAWWERFEDPVLTALLEQTFAHNLSLAEARSRWEAARALRRYVSADGALSLDGTAGYTRTVAGTKAAVPQGPAPGNDLSLFSAGLAAVWELDLFGRIERLEEAAEADLEKVEAMWRGVGVSIAAEVALAYLDVRLVDERLDLLERKIEVLDATLAVVKSASSSGLGSVREELEIRKQLETLGAEKPPLLLAKGQAEHRLAVLTGAPPQAGGFPSGPTPDVPRGIAMGVPLDVVERRPDIREAERQYAAAVARLGVAEAERYPSLSLSGTLNLQSAEGSELFDAESYVYGVGPSVRVPLLTGGRTTQRVLQRKAEADAAWFAMKAAVLEALREVEDAALGVVRTDEELRALQRTVAISTEDLERAEALETAGLEGTVEVLQAEFRLLLSKEAVVQGRHRNLVQTVQLYRALGGGWEKRDPLSMPAEGGRWAKLD